MTRNRLLCRGQAWGTLSSLCRSACDMMLSLAVGLSRCSIAKSTTKIEPPTRLRQIGGRSVGVAQSLADDIATTASTAGGCSVDTAAFADLSKTQLATLRTSKTPRLG